MDFATFLKIQSVQNQVLEMVAPQATELLSSYDTMDIEEFYQALFNFSADLTALASTLVAEICVGAEAFAKISEELEELHQIQKIVMDSQ